MKRIFIFTLGFIFTVFSSAAPKPVKVFILAGQSNMEGRGFPEPLSWQISQKKYKERYAHFIKNGDYKAFTKKVNEATGLKD